MLSGVAVALLNHLLDGAPWARARLSPHAGSRARVLAGGISLDLSIAGNGQFAECLSEEPPQVIIHMPAPLPAELAAGLGSLVRKARVEGEVDLADSLGFVFRNLRWDIEDDLAKVVGDIAAHRIHGSAQAVLKGGLKAVGAVEANLREFVAEGTTPLLSAGQLGERGRLLQGMRDTLARLEKRVDRLDRLKA
ncbi:MAG: hypothetical protein KDH15_13385 [Rhodocyclaceae bacterium]|nr:hypothetical protein [Rhodocyclaceae bacterium]